METMFTMSMECEECGGYGCIPVTWEDHARYHACYRCGTIGFVAAYSVLPYSAPAWRIQRYLEYIGREDLLDRFGALRDLSSYRTTLASADELERRLLEKRFSGMSAEVSETVFGDGRDWYWLDFSAFPHEIPF